tara:strand:+ start:11064 stop:11888 length:825 start_codon:yes stop_codon:yes gene_type:complete
MTEAIPAAKTVAKSKATSKKTANQPWAQSQEAVAEHIWRTLSAIDCSQHVKEKGNLSYLSWAWAYGMVMDAFPTFRYKVNPVTIYNDGTASVSCTVGVQLGEFSVQRDMWLPVMKTSGRPVSICNPDSMAINTASMRCLTKGISMLGLGAYIYAGEDLPAEKEEEPAYQYQQPVIESSQPLKPRQKLESQAGVDAADFMPRLVDEEGAAQVVDVMLSIGKATCKTTNELRGYWTKNGSTINAIEERYPAQHLRLNKSFIALSGELPNSNQEQQQ